MTETQPYEVLESFPRFELRRYPAHIVAEVEVTGSFEGAGNKAFGPLVSFIGGKNSTQHKVAMTAPVIQSDVASERIAMTAPVLQSEATATDRYVVSFVMPASYTIESVPKPDNPDIRLREIPAHKAAVLRFTGRWSAKSYDEKAAQLRSMLSEQGFALAGPLQFARYDPPWTPWFMRRNEIVAPVAD